MSGWEGVEHGGMEVVGTSQGMGPKSRSESMDRHPGEHHTEEGDGEHLPGLATGWACVQGVCTHFLTHMGARSGEV